MTAIVLRNIDAPAHPRGYASPADVPAHVDDVALAAALRAGRPEGVAGLIHAGDVACPTITAGTGAPVLCVHGLGHDSWDFAPLFVRCNTRHTMIALDLPGFGLADLPAACTLDLLVDAVLAAAGECAAKHGAAPVVIGSSLGGHVALLAALREPRAFAKLVLAAPGGVIDVPSAMRSMAHAYYSVDAICGRSDGEIANNSRRIFAKPGHPLDDALAARKLAVHRSAQRREFAVPFAAVVADVFNHIVLDRLPEITLPSLVLTGERDVVVPPDASAHAARRMNAQFVSFPGVGHTPHLEAPDAFADAVLRFLDETSGAVSDGHTVRRSA